VAMPLTRPSTHAGAHPTTTHLATNTHLVTTPVNATTSASQADSSGGTQHVEALPPEPGQRYRAPTHTHATRHTAAHTLRASGVSTPHNHTPCHNTTFVNQPNPLPTPVKQDSMHSTKCAPWLTMTGIFCPKDQTGIACRLCETTYTPALHGHPTHTFIRQARTKHSSMQPVVACAVALVNRGALTTQP
jgi:hypothetical protein